MLEKVLELEKALNSLFLEREDEVRGIILSLMCREHCLFIGPPGTAKSALVEAAAKMSGLTYFRALVTKFTTPDELFGPPDLAALERGEYQRRTAGMLPEAEVVFLDEIFKASPSILNTLLSIMQERLFRNGMMYSTPLVSMFGASNEVPEGEEDIALAAFQDRFLLKYSVKPIKDSNSFIKLLMMDEPTENLTLINVSWKEIFREMDGIKVHDDIYTAIYEIKKKLAEEENSFPISDRRWKKCIKLLKAHALLEKRSEVIEDDFEVLVHALWDPALPETKKTVQKVIQRITDPISIKLNELIQAAEEAANQALSAPPDKEADLGLEAIKSLKRIMMEIDSISVSVPKKQAKIDAAKAKITELQKQVGAKCLGLAL
ncbi:ATPase RavA [Fervidicola ferrireducens]|uniref:ATPase RavA n=1 Tax=Fervidicola ferrireducens TaxID=520764 RepID=A0A140L4P5_9FIRM|nr:AAA family ATPase [Fervidicola ferrireducens]KXG75520.1 ATPase RavA [Fervidicola ferrireducens]